jgi:hypothetical protein
MEDLLREAAERAMSYLAGIDERSVSPRTDVDFSLISGPFPMTPPTPRPWLGCSTSW